MPIPKDIVEQQILRLLVSEENRNRLVKELKGLDQEAVEKLAAMIKEHDTEAMGILAEKTEKQEAIKDEFQAQMPQEGAKSASIQELGAIFEEAFSTPEKMAEFLGNADEVILMKVSEFLQTLTEDEPERADAIGHFFREIMLQKQAFHQELGEEEAKILMGAVEQKKEKISELDELIAEAEEVLKNSE